MKKSIIFAGIVAIVAAFSSCSVTMPLAVSAAPIGSKVGTSSTTVLFGAWQVNKNFGIAEAAHNGKITGGVGVADLKTTNFVFFKKLEIIAHGN
ncbi:MAG: TRL-like protein family [Bacteroidetes bacterium]|jgi:hypothetical protein|nr:TRL-like protein family [Bacteroidota bacterium]